MSAAGLSIALVVRNEERNLGDALASLVPDTHPSFPWEIIVVDNNSSDATRAAFERFRLAHPAFTCRWIDHSPNHLGRARARAVNEAAYDTVAFLDGDCRAPRSWARDGYSSLRALAARDPHALGLGSGNRVAADGTPFAEALRLVLSSWFGGLNTVQARPRRAPVRLSHIPTCNIFYVKSRLLALGNFSADFSRVCEDLELHQRAAARGFWLHYQPGLEVEHHHRSHYGAWAEKMFRYGWGQIEVARLYPRHLLGIKALPLLFVSFLAVGAVFYPQFILGVILAYVAALWLLAFSYARLALTPRVFTLLAITHLAYGAGELWGVGRQIKQRKMQQDKG